MKKGVFLAVISVVLLIILAVGIASAANETLGSGDKIDKAYKCLQDELDARSAVSLQEAIFSMLAGANTKKNLGGVIEDEKKSPESCWPKSGCRLKETAQVALAYQKAGRNSQDAKKWILTKNSTTVELKWFLEIDIANQAMANCIIKDGQKENKIQILESQIISGSPGNCLSIDGNGYMLRINNNCVKNNFEVSCDQDFITTTLYQKSTGGTLFVSPETHSAAASGFTKEKVNGECFKTEGACDYEGSLWAALAMHKMGQDVSGVVPYLLALADDNPKYFPSAFLYALIGGDEQYNLVIQSQKQGKFWEITGGNKFYDTSLAMLGLGGREGAELTAAKDYLLSIQTDKGCWNNNNIRDTAFILYSGWQRAGGGGAGEGTGATPCEPLYSCENAFECTNAGGEPLYDFECSGADICCSLKVQKPTCAEKKGLLCTEEQSCEGRVESAADGSCCFGACVQIEEREDLCSPAGGECKISCDEGELESGETCADAYSRCCISEGSSMWFWIVLLIILIIIAVLAIIYREKLKIWWFKLKEKFRKGKSPQRAPMLQPRTPGAVPRQVAPAAYMRMRPAAPIRAAPPKDKDMEETLKKLKEMAGKK
jgi:hypothetical protein